MRRIVAVAVVLLLLVGCGPKGKKGAVTGTVTYKGQPVNNAALLLYPASGGNNPITVPVTQEGTFSASDLPPGEYKVVVQGSAAQGAASGAAMATKPTIQFPNKYKQLTSTDLKCTVAKGQETVNLDLKD
jgi:hypothetical protein